MNHTGRTQRAAWPIGVGIVVVLLAASADAAEFNFFELEAYPAQTMPDGEIGLESFTTVVAQGRPGGSERGDDEDAGEAPSTHRLLRTSIGLDYGLTPRIEIGARFDLTRPNAEDVDVAGGRLRTRMLLCEACAGLVDLGGYLELEAPKDGETDFEVATRLIVSRRFGRFEVRANPIFSLPVVSHERRTIEFGYATGMYADVAERLRIGTEAFGGTGEIRRIDPSRDQQHYMFLVASSTLLGRCSIAGGPGFGITRESDSVVLKLGVDCDL
jgi:hypothetical protein